MSEFTQFKKRLSDFASERDWDQFHSPKNLAMALSVEVAELQEHFQWLTEAESVTLEDQVLAQVAEEIADVQAYLIRLADKLGIDIVASLDKKIIKNQSRYPADKVRGSAKKYTEYADD